MAGTGIATVFVDHDLRILRFTPAATRITNLLPGDVGRPVTQIASNLKAYDRLGDDVRSVLATLEPRTEEVEAGDGRWYTLRIHPYRTLENVVEGAVITFIDVTERRRTDAALMAAFEVAQGRISEVAPPPTESQP
jgi:two-component system CheB/CheR fusion protein